MSIFTTMLFSSGMPLLYFSSFIQFSVLYWVDKVYFFKICKFPKFYNDEMQETVNIGNINIIKAGKVLQVNLVVEIKKIKNMKKINFF